MLMVSHFSLVFSEGLCILQLMYGHIKNSVSICFLVNRMYIQIKIEAYIPVVVLKGKLVFNHQNTYNFNLFYSYTLNNFNILNFQLLINFNI